MTTPPAHRLPRRGVLLGAGLAGVSACGLVDRTDPPALRYTYVEQEAAQPALADALTAFTERTGRQVRLEPAPWEEYENLLAAQLTGGDPPDLVVVWVPASLAGLAGQGLLLPLEPYRLDPLELADVSEPTLALGQAGGVQYAVTTGLGSQVAALSPRTFTAADEPLPTGAVTWSELFDLCVRLSSGTAAYAFGLDNPLGVDIPPDLLEYWLRQRDRSLFTPEGQLGFEPPDLTDWLTYWVELGAAGGCPAGSPDVPADSNEGSRPSWGQASEAAIRFVDTVVYQLETDSGFGPDVRLAPMPRPDAADAQPGYFYQSGVLLAVPAAARHPDAAAELLWALALDPAIAPGLYGTTWYGVPSSAAVRDALAARPDTGAGYLETVDYVISLVDQVDDPPPPPPATANLVMDELAFHASEVGTGRMSVAGGVDAFFTIAPGLL